MEEGVKEEIKEAKTVVNVLRNFAGVKKFKSIQRAIRRGHMSIDGYIYPRRPYNNRRHKVLEDQKRILYKQLKEYGRRIRNTTV